MNFDPNQFGMLKIDKVKIASQISLFVGGVLLFISLWIPFPSFVFTSIIGALLIGFYFGYKLYLKSKDKKTNEFVKIKKKKKNKVQKGQRIEGDNEHILSICPECSQKLRLPYKKGKHYVTCPKCHKEYQIKVK